MATEAQKRAVAKYDKKNTKTFALKLNKKFDADIISRLNRVGNVQGYIKRLVRKDIISDGNNTDPVRDRTDGIDPAEQE